MLEYENFTYYLYEIKNVNFQITDRIEAQDVVDYVQKHIQIQNRHLHGGPV